MSSKILFVDDDARALSGYRRILHGRLAIETALGPEQGLATVSKQGPYAVVVADMKMPVMDGVQFLTKVEEMAPDTVRMMITGNADLETAVIAVNRGHVFRFLTKPCPLEILAPALEGALKQYLLIIAERELLERTLNGSIKTLTEILSMVDPKSFGRAQQFREYVRTFAGSRQASKVWELELAAMLSPLGFVTVPSSLLERWRGGLGLTAAEQEVIDGVPETGANLLANIPRLEDVVQIIRYQNKNFDGTGHPMDKVAGEDIPIGARILKVLADLVALESQKIPKHEALARMRQTQGRYDPKVIEAVAASFDLYLLPSAAGTVLTRSVSLGDLPVGSVLTAGVETREGMLLVSAGTTISQVILERLGNFARLTGITEPITIEYQPERASRRPQPPT